MQTNVFPYTYDQQVNSRVITRIATVRSHNSDQIASINQQHYSQPSGNSSILGWFLGIMGGFIPCTCVCMSRGDEGDTGIGAWIIFAFVCGVIGTIIDKMSQSAYKTNEANISERISRANREMDEEIERIKQEAEREKQLYLAAFENNAQDMSVQFAESELAREVIDWMTKGFITTIRSADRRNHVEQISIPFVFKVFADKITCSLGTYDFELRRCRNLTSPLEQTALARAIATAIQLNIIMEYPRDPSGTDVTIRIGYSFTESCPVVSVVYVAPNGKYEVVRGW